MSDAQIKLRWRPDQPEAEAWELRCRFAARIGTTQMAIVVAADPAACLTALKREVLRLALGDTFLGQEVAL